MTESITRIRGTGLPGPSPLGIMLPLLQIRPFYPRLFPSSPLPTIFSLSLSSSFGPLFQAFSLSLFFFFFFYSLSLSPPLFALHALLLSFFKLTHPLSPFLEHQGLLSFSRVIDPSSSASFLLSPPLPSPLPYPYRAYYVIRITIICFETASTAHQSE